MNWPIRLGGTFLGIYDRKEKAIDLFNGGDHGQTMVESAKKSGETSSTERLRRSLASNKVGGTKQKIDNGSPSPLWTIASKQLLNRPK